MADAPIGTSPLLQTVRANAAAAASPTGPTAAQTGLAPTGGEATAQAAALMGTAQTGKATSNAGGTAALSAVGERLAGMNTLMAAHQVQAAGALQSEAQSQQAQAQTQSFQGQLTQLSEERLTTQSTYQDQVRGMLQQEADQVRSMGLADDKSRVEQMGLMLRLGDDKYITQLQSEATKARLDNKANWGDALNRSVFAQETDLLGSSLTFRNYMQSSLRDTTRTLAGMDIDFAVQVATVNNKAAAAQTMWSGIGTLGGAGAAYAASPAATPATGPSGPEGNLVQQAAENPEGGTPAANPSAAAAYQGNIGSLDYLQSGG